MEFIDYGALRGKNYKVIVQEYKLIINYSGNN